VAKSALATRISRFVLKAELSDPMSGFFMIRTDIVRTLAPRLSAIGFKMNTGSIASLANGTQVGTANSGIDGSNIYVVGKSIASMGATASRTANNNALREMLEGEKTYWNPAAGTIKSIIEEADFIKVYVKPLSLAPEIDQNSLVEYTFFKDGENGKDGWLLQSESITNLDPTAIVNLETSQKRNMNGDTSVGLQTTPLSGLIQGSIGTTKFFFVGQTKPVGMDPTRLLTDINGNGSPWRPAAGETPTTLRLTESSDLVPDDIKDAAKWTLITTGSNNKYYFNSQYQQL
jgi:hypothetical protein